VSRFSDSAAVNPQWEPAHFAWSQLRVDDTDVMILTGDLDLTTAEKLRPPLMGVAESGTAGMILLDLSSLRFIDAYSVRLIVAAWQAAQHRGAQLQVDGLNGIPATIFEVLGLDELLARTEATDGGRGTDD